MPRILRKILQKLNAPICRKMYGALQNVHPNRPVQKTDTLIIGDLCSDKILGHMCQLNSSIKIMLPNRSLKTSKLILAHFTSVLPEGGRVIIVDRGSKSDISCYDYPFLSQISRLELGLIENNRKMNNPLLYMPLQSLRLLFGLSMTKYSILECPDKEIVEMCCRKQFVLSYLKSIN